MIHRRHNPTGPGIRRRPLAAVAGLVVPALAGLCCLPGCGEEDPQAVAEVRDLLVRWHRAMLDGDRRAYLACFTGTEQMLEMEAAQLAFHQAAMRFRDRYIAAYGRDAWADHQDTPGAQLRTPPADADYPHRIEIRMKGHYALLTWPDSPRNRMYRVNRTPDGWKMVAGQWLGYTAGGRADIDKTTAINQALAAEIRKMTGKIGRAGVSAERITAELAERMQQVARQFSRAVFTGQSQKVQVCWRP